MTDKIVPLETLAHICKTLKQEGKKVVQCHGCFDLLHPGHIRHFKAAKNYGDVLIVTVTPDRFVKKGPGRPVFNERLRMESIAALGFVDYVSLNKWETAVDTINLMKPNFYVKGSDYSNREDDITANIIKEEKAVKENGGEIRITYEITFSSSKLINDHFSILSDRAQAYIDKFKLTHSPSELIDLLKGLSDINVLVIGDVIIDEYAYCSAVGKPEKSPVISARYYHSELFGGGSMAIANHLGGFVNSVHLVSCLGEIGDNKESFIQDNLKSDVVPHFFNRKDAPTIVKKRYIEKFNNVKLFEITDINDEYIDGELESSIIAKVNEIIDENDIDIILIADFGHGLLTPGLIDELTAKDVFVSVNAQTNSMNFGFNLITKYRDVDYISIDENELRLPYQSKHVEVEELVKKLQNGTNCNKINITLGSSGSIFHYDGKIYYVPVFSSNIVDTVGAGDAVLSISSLLAYRDVDPNILPFVGNCVGALAVNILGNKESISPIDLFKFIEYMLK